MLIVILQYPSSVMAALIHTYEKTGLRNKTAEERSHHLLVKIVGDHFAVAQCEHEPLVAEIERTTILSADSHVNLADTITIDWRDQHDKTKSLRRIGSLDGPSRDLLVAVWFDLVVNQITKYRTNQDTDVG